MHLSTVLNHCKYFNAIRKSCDKGLTTKEHIVTHTHLNLKLEAALYFSALDIKLFNSGMKLFEAKIIITTL